MPLIKVGDTLPEAKLFVLSQEGAPKSVVTTQFFKGKKVVLFAVPGAFTPACSKSHCPTFVSSYNQIRAKGVDIVACVAINDAFVLDAWSKSQNAQDKVIMLADGNAEFTKAIGMDFDASAVGLGTRSQRYVMIIDNLVVKHLEVEDVPSQVKKTAASQILARL